MKLSERQTFILLELARGQSKKMIADDLNCSITNVANIMGRLRKRLGAPNRRSLVTFAILKDCITLDSIQKHIEQRGVN